MTDTLIERRAGTASNALNPSESSLSLALVPNEAQGLLLKMFANPHILAEEERTDLVAQLRECVMRYPDNSEFRVLLGMALCVNLEPQEAVEELGEAVSLAPDSFIAHLKMGELWMRLRVCSKAGDHTRQAAMLAQNMAQAELARRQATTIRTMMREGIERGGYRRPWLSLARFRKQWRRYRGKVDALAAADIV